MLLVVYVNMSHRNFNYCNFNHSICERITPRLSHANAAVVLSAVKVFSTLFIFYQIVLFTIYYQFSDAFHINMRLLELNAILMD